MQTRSTQGFSLVEVMFALGILTVGVLSAAAVMAAGMQHLASSPADVMVTQKAAQAIEAVFAARDSHKLTWAQIRNAAGETGTDNGVFVDDPQQLHLSGADGLVNTGDDEDEIESFLLPGMDRELGTSDDDTVVLSQYTRQITIRDVPGEAGQLRTVTVTMKYRSGRTERTYTLQTLISSYS